MSTVIIVGVGPGIGTSVATRFAREGFTVGLIARREETVQAAAAAAGGTTWTRTADATDEEGLRAALRAFVDEHGTPDVVVYNAAIIRTDEPGELDQATMLDTYAVNVVGAITTAGELLPRMTGTYVITSGMVRPDPALTSLSLGKVGVRGLVDCSTPGAPRCTRPRSPSAAPSSPAGRGIPTRSPSTTGSCTPVRSPTRRSGTAADAARPRVRRNASRVAHSAALELSVGHSRDPARRPRRAGAIATRVAATTSAPPSASAGRASSPLVRATSTGPTTCPTP